MTPELLRAYEATTYTAETPRGCLRLRVGGAQPALDALLADHGCRTWAFVSANNPHSQPLDQAENGRRHVALAEAAAGRPHFEGQGIADAGGWPAERSLLVLGLADADAAALGRRFGQIAVLAGAADGPARLLVCER